MLFALVVLIGAVSVAVVLIHRSRRPAARAIAADDQLLLPRTPARKLLDGRYVAGTVDFDEYLEHVTTLEQNG